MVLVDKVQEVVGRWAAKIKVAEVDKWVEVVGSIQVVGNLEVMVGSIQAVDRVVEVAAQITGQVEIHPQCHLVAKVEGKVEEVVDIQVVVSLEEDIQVVVNLDLEDTQVVEVANGQVETPTQCRLDGGENGPLARHSNPAMMDSC